MVCMCFLSYLFVCLVTLKIIYLFIYLLIYFTLQINSNVVRLKNLKICHIQKEQLRSERLFSVTLINFRNIFWLFILNSNVFIIHAMWCFLCNSSAPYVSCQHLPFYLMLLLCVAQATLLYCMSLRFSCLMYHTPCHFYFVHWFVRSSGGKEKS